MKEIIAYLFISILSFAECINISVADCDITKKCIRNVQSCSISEPNCLFFSYAWNVTTSLFDMEMSGGSGNGQQWYGIAFSPTGTMMNSDLYICTGTKFLSGVILGRRLPTILSELPPRVMITYQETLNSVGRCSFTRPASVTKQISGGEQRDFNLLEEEFHLLQAFGSYNDGQQPAIIYHQRNRWSSGPHNFSQFNSFTNIMDGCTETKTCFSSPQGCNPFSDSCLFASWNSNPTKEAFTFEIFGGTPGRDNQYIGIAFGTTDDMQDADLYYCTESRLVSAVISERRRPPTVIENTNPIVNYNVEVVNGVIRCRFTRLRSAEKTISNNIQTDFDLADTEYYLLMATGQLTDEQMLIRHGSTSADRVISTTKINFSSASGLHLNINVMILGFLLYMMNIWTSQ